MIYLIGGVPRAGKSTLAKKMTKERDVSFLSTDYLVNMIHDTNPELHFVEPYSEIIYRFFPYLDNLLKAISSTISDYCIEGDAFSPEQVTQLKKKYDIKACFLGFSQVNMEDIRKYSWENDWIDDLPEEKQKELPDYLLSTSRKIAIWCENNNIQYFDMASGDFQDNIQKAFEYLGG